MDEEGGRRWGLDTWINFLFLEFKRLHIEHHFLKSYAGQEKAFIVSKKENKISSAVLQESMNPDKCKM